MSNFLRSMAARGYSLKTDKMSKQREYLHLIYRGDQCIAKCKLKQDADVAMKAFIKADYQKLVEEMNREPVIDIRPGS